ncbi:hypothetical protein [Alteripontixanthobacter maritimus]|uniref:hypothetical protein n=1 Tax=Alteripontixanthobacter maritimus TaxID=2161824 RepID=UPI0011C03916|nr:hypothetical protein [Alteripontixanthobacter maritimus]
MFQSGVGKTGVFPNQTGAAGFARFAVTMGGITRETAARQWHLPKPRFWAMSLEKPDVGVF